VSDPNLTAGALNGRKRAPVSTKRSPLSLRLALVKALLASLFVLAPVLCPSGMTGEERTVPQGVVHDGFGEMLTYRDMDRGTLVHDRLENGVQLLVMEIPSSTVAYGMVAVRVGARYEEAENAGISHLLEHLLFRESAGSENLNRIRSSGGTVNALTDMELTSYHFTVLPHHFNGSMKGLAHLVLEPQFSPDDLEREREVVLEELAMGRNDPRAVVLMQLVREIFPDSPLNSFVIGTRESIESIGHAQIEEFYRTHYIPGNMIVIAAGKVRAPETLQFLRSLFGGLEPRSIPVQNFVVPEPALNSLVKKIPINQSFYVFGTLTPGRSAKEYRAMEVLHALLVSGTNSRLHRRVVLEEGYTEQLYPQWFSYSNTGIWAVFLSVRPGDMEAVSGLIADEIDAVKRGGFSDEELETAKEGLVSRATISLDRPEDLARFQLENLVYGNPPMTLAEYAGTLRGVSRREVMETAQACFTEERTVTIEMKPARGPERWLLILKYLTTKSL
jgi:predicted Zn-dependent peptidase